MTAQGRIVADPRRRPIVPPSPKARTFAFIRALFTRRLPDRETVFVQYLPHSNRTAAANFTIVIMWLLLLVGLL